MNPDGYDTFDWRERWVAEEHDRLNRCLFEDGDPAGVPYFSVLGDMIVEAGKQDILTGSEWCSILDVGCGAGWQRVYLGREGFMERTAYTGIDISEHMISLARKNLAACGSGRKDACRPDEKNEPDVFETADIMEYECRDCAFALVMSCGVIELFEDWRAFVSRLAALGSDGILLHKIFFEKRAHRQIVSSYGGKQEARTFLLREEFNRFVEGLRFDIVCVRRLLPDYPSYSVLLKKRPRNE